MFIFSVQLGSVYNHELPPATYPYAVARGGGAPILETTGWILEYKKKKIHILLSLFLYLNKTVTQLVVFLSFFFVSFVTNDFLL